MRVMYELAAKHPKVFAIVTDEEGRKRLGVNANAPLEELFDAYSNIVHYVEGPTVQGLEELIREKIRERERNDMERKGDAR